MPFDKNKMHDGHSRCVAQVSYMQFYIIIYNALVDAQNLKSGPSFELHSINKIESHDVKNYIMTSKVQLKKARHDVTLPWPVQYFV